MGILTSRKYAPRRPRREPSKRVTVALLTALAVAAAVLSGLALLTQNERGPTTDGNSIEMSTPAPVSSEQNTSNRGETSTTDDAIGAPAGGTAVQSTRVLSVSDDPNRLVRAEGNECGTESVLLQTSSDGGKTWNTADTSSIDVDAIRHLQFANGGRVQLAYMDYECSLQYARSFVYGGAWENYPGGEGVWFIDYDEKSNELLMNEAPVETPCEPTRVSGIAETGAVLCKDESVVLSNDGGKTWAPPVLVPGAIDISLDGNSVYVVSLNGGECEGLNIRRMDDGASGDPIHCEAGAFQPSEVVSAVRGGSLYIWAEDEVFSVS